MFPMLLSFLRSFRVYFQSRADLQTEILALRHQIVALRRPNSKPKLKPADRLFWVALCHAGRAGVRRSGSLNRLLLSTGTAAVSVRTGHGRFDMDNRVGRVFQKRHAS